MSGPGGVSWLAGEHATFEEALSAGGDVRRQLVEAGPRLPKKDISRLYPATMADATSIVNARMEEKKKAAQNKQKSKSKPGAPQSPSESHFPGARLGGNEPSAFWMYIEDYFRDFTQDDLRALLPLMLDPREDPAFKVPACGRRVEDEQQQRRHAAARAAAEAARAAEAAASRDWDSRAAAAGQDSLSPDAERRSSRLVSRHSKEEEQRRHVELEAQAAAAASAAEQAEAAAAAAAARAMVAPTTPSGAPAQQLMDVLPDQRLALLLQQLTDLQQLVGVKLAAPANPSPAVQAALEKLKTAASSNGSVAALEPAARAELQDWLRQHLASLADHLGCSLPVLPPWAGQPAADSSGQDPAAPAAGSGQQEPAGGSKQQGAAPPAAAAAAAAGATADAKVPAAFYLHPYTELMLQHPVQHHTVQQAVEAAPADAPGRQATLGREEQAAIASIAAAAAVEDGDASAAVAGAAGAVAGDVATPGTSLITATPGSATRLQEVPSVANLSSLLDQHGAAPATGDTAATDTPATGGHPGQASPAVPMDVSMPGLPGAAGVAEDGTPLDPAAAAAAAAGQQQGPGGSGSAPSRAGGRARGVSNYALLAGKKSGTRPTGPPKKAVRTATAAKPEAEAGPSAPIARAVAAMVAAGEADAPARGASQQQQAAAAAVAAAMQGGCSELLAAAPEDEVLAEMLAVQNELMQQVAINRARLVPALAGVLSELEGRRAEAELQAREEADVKAWILKMREIKRQQHRHRREQAHQDSLAAKQQFIIASPRPVLGRQRFSEQAEAGAETYPREGSPPLEFALRQDELYDVLAQREPEQESFCAVCGDGHSEAPNQIVFCERCDVAVHQQCYGIAVVPDGEWLCEPCREYEDRMRAQGASQEQLRPASWQAADAEHRPPLEGGARSCRCLLCPIKYGAFKKSEDGQHWVHSACALWLPETSLSHREVPGVGRQEFVAGLDKVRPDRLDARCAICGQTGGAIMACQQPGGCQNAFHVLCARNIGLYLTIRPDPSRKTGVQYRIYCALHSRAQQQRDEKAWQERLERAQQQQQKESKAKQAERLAAAKLELQKAEGERHMMHVLRANLESCRMLIDVTKRRERLKKQLVVLQQQQWPLFQQDPDAALQLLQHRQAEQEQQQQQAAAADAAAAAAAATASAAMAAAAAAVSQQQQQPQQQQQQPEGLPDLGLLPPLPQQQQQQQQQQQLGLPQIGLQPMQQQQQLQQLPIQSPAMLSMGMGSMGMNMGMGMPSLSPAGSLPLMPAPPQQQHQPVIPLPQGPPSFALDMFSQHPQQFFMQQQQQQQQGAQLLPPAASSAAMAAAAVGFPPLPLPLQHQQQHGSAASLGALPAHSNHQQQQAQQAQQAQGHAPELPAAAAGLLVNVPGRTAAAATVPPDVAAALFGPPSGLHAPGMQLPSMSQHQQQQQQAMLARVDPAVAAALQAQQAQQPMLAGFPGVPVGMGPASGSYEPSPSPRHPAYAAAAAAGGSLGTAGTPRGVSPAASVGAASGRPKRAAAQAGANKRRRGSSEEPAGAVGAAGLLGAQHGAGGGGGGSAAAQAAAADLGGGGGVAAAAGRRQRTASVKVRENLLQRERQMTAEEADALNARLPGPLRYLPAAELEATLGLPNAAGQGGSRAGGSAGGSGQRPARPRTKPPPK